MIEAAVIAKIVFVMIGAQVTGYSEGTGAFYAEGVMEQVCRHRVSHGWQPDLDCSRLCLVSGIEHDSLGQRWLVDIPGGSFYDCLVVDVGAGIDLPALRARGEIVEIPHWLAMKAGWNGYVDDVKVWRLGR